METKTTSKALNELRAQMMPPGLSSVTSCYVASGKGACYGMSKAAAEIGYRNRWILGRKRGQN
jgi:hypothetical protein